LNNEIDQILAGVNKGDRLTIIFDQFAGLESPLEVQVEGLDYNDYDVLVQVIVKISQKGSICFCRMAEGNSINNWGLC